MSMHDVDGTDDRRPVGRRPGDSDTREQIRLAAAARFASEGFQATTMRAVAADADVDPALVMHYFKNKAGLFQEAMQFPPEHADLMATAFAGDPATLGQRIVGTVFATVDRLGDANPILGLLRSATSDANAARMLREYFRAVIFSRLSEHFDVDHPSLRAELCASQLLGGILARQVLELPELGATSPERLAVIYGATLQRYLTADLPE